MIIFLTLEIYSLYLFFLKALKIIVFLFNRVCKYEIDLFLNRIENKQNKREKFFENFLHEFRFCWVVL